MARYRVRLTKEVTDTLDAFVEVDAADENAAGDAALAIAASGKPDLDWQLAYADALGGTKPEIDSITECNLNTGGN